ncbi:malonate decarboxylase holo-[acyl-carrier-protein] synthase [Rugamonas sp.]|uniref:malonate decarboxylase holo-[acyl-carrier-protein] synthase n=1 Tax=Rugamonas sp. TaxID=1926287 RepID=UPI0025DB9E47|nr:malonate decarboxylase holo-[acyl-carrier-protein] synthase [Rugamonas sp.]
MLSRHNLVWLSPQGWQDAADGAAPEHRPALEKWRRNDWPAVVRRRDANAHANEVCLGVPLPPDPASGQKLRITLRAQALEVVKSVPPLSLKSVLPSLPSPWREELTAFDNRAVGLVMRVYGSVALQVLTAQPYMTPTSDVDILFYPATSQQLNAGLALLSFHATRLPLDGEIVFPSGQAVSWKEWLQAQAAAAHVLVKEADSVHLAPPNALLATLRQP